MPDILIKQKFKIQKTHYNSFRLTKKTLFFKELAPPSKAASRLGLHQKEHCISKFAEENSVNLEH